MAPPCCFEGVFKSCFPQKANPEKLEPNAVQKLAGYLGLYKFSAYVIMDASWISKLCDTMVRTPAAYGMAYEDVRIEALDGCTLAAWHIPAQDKSSKKLAIVGHQSWACANKSGCETHQRHGWVTVEAIDYVKLQKVLHDAGFHVLAYDLRNHGESEKKLPSGFGEIEYMDAVGVMNYVNSHPVLKTCKVCLLPFCVSGVAFMKANTLHPEKFKNVVAWATTNIFHGPTIMSNRPYMFGLGNVKLLNKAFAEKQASYEKSGQLKSQDIKITAQRISAKPYAPDVKVPILYCDVMHDVLDYHEASCPDIFAEFGKSLPEEQRKRNELHFLGPHRPMPFTTKGRNRSRGKNLRFSAVNSSGCILQEEILAVPCGGFWAFDCAESQDESLSSLSALSEVGMDDSVTQVLDQARECAVEKVVCPICFEALSDLPNQVGALTFEGKRVESALYHHDCVHNHATNRLVFASETGKAVSPLTRRQVDNFKVMPALTDSEEWVSFLDWNRTGHLDLQKVCFAVAALLPVDDAYARRFVLQVMNLPEDSEEAHEVSQQEVIQTLLPQIRRQLRRLVKTPRPRPPEICRNSEKEELLAWFRFWDSKKEGRLDTSTLQLAVVATFHTALAKTADAATKAAIAQSFCTEMGLRECDHVTEEQFMEKMAPHLVSNLPVAIERNTRSSGFFDPKLSLTLHLRDMKSGAERPLYFETAGEVTVKDLKAATLRRFPVLLCRRTVKIFVMGQQLEDDFQPLFHLRGIYVTWRRTLWQGNVWWKRPQSPRRNRLWTSTIWRALTTPRIPPLMRISIETSMRATCVVCGRSATRAPPPGPPGARGCRWEVVPARIAAGATRR
ncbi:unnamed protein product [Durusdinium trenchii]|uniref:Uncharacterized protein n=1 Tax=Durusdinium trenchii TaxID=1381693 RepID=A0ABP0SZ19_9DINO